MVILVGLKLLADWYANSAEHPKRVDFQDASSIAFWVFWGSLAVCFGIGFLPARPGED
jgi:hypothetical protein